LARPQKKNAPDGSPSMRDQIKKVARDLFIQRGISDVSYGDIAEVVGTTRANLHYHFGTKAALVDEVFKETFESVEAHFRDVWTRPGLTLDARIRLIEEDCSERFYQFNTDIKGHNPWSLSARARIENHMLSEETRQGISRMSRHFEEYTAHAVKLAIGNGELRPDAPVRDIVLMIASLWYCGSPLTQYSGLRKLLEHYAAVRQTIAAAYGTEQADAGGPRAETGT
jgi:TetR/AcrR family transcriptional repressor of nem operon